MRMVTQQNFSGYANDVEGRESWLSKPLFASLTLEHVLYIAFILIAIISRFYDMGARVMSHDESLHTYYSYNLATGKGFQHTPLMHGPFLFHITALSYFLFGDSDFTSRLPMALLGIVLVAMPVFFRRWIGRAGALVAALGILISPTILYHARYIRQEQSVLVWTMLTALCVWRYIETKRWGWLIALAVVLGFHATDKSTSFLNVAMFVAFLTPLALWQLYAARSKLKDALMLAGFGAALGLLMLAVTALYAAVSVRLAQALNLQITVGANPVVLSLDRQELIFIGLLLVLSVPLVAGMVFLLRSTFGAWLREASENASALNPLLVMVVTTLFMASPALLLVLNRIWHRVSGSDLVAIELLGNMSNLQNNGQVVTTMFAITFALIAISVAIGLVWNAQRWLVVVAVFLGITVPLFTTLFTNGAGMGTGFVGQLGYWMAQQDVKRGSQPWYYYFIIVPLYEYVLVLGSLCAVVFMAYRLVMYWRTHRVPVRMPEPLPTADPSAGTQLMLDGADIFGTTDEPVRAAHPENDTASLFAGFLVWWTVATWLIYSIAGEKMPWLSVHFALPMVLLTGWFVNRIANADVIAQFRERRGWAVVGLSLLGVVLMGRLLSLIGGFDLGSGQATQTFSFVGNVLVAVFALVAVFYALGKLVSPGVIGRMLGLGIFMFLAVLTVRTAVTVTYINYDYTKEFLFYAHGGPGVKVALNQIDELSKRLGSKDPLKIGYDSDTSWPMSWYMRDFPGQRFYGEALPGDFEDLQVILMGDGNPKRAEIEPQLTEKYTKFDYMLVWWPMQDYFDLEKPADSSTFRESGWNRIKYMLSTPKTREALWEIIFNRNYEPYAQLFNRRDLTPESWSPGHRFNVYVRNDVAAQVWDYRVGEIAGAPARPATAPSSAKVQSPAMLAFAPDGAKFVIDHRANRVFELDAANNVIKSFGGFGGATGKFNDAWGIAVDSLGNILVADTFNHRVQKFDRDGNFLSQWGKPGVSDQPGTGQDTVFFGPRDIKIDRNGYLLVTDTGNKRVQVFDSEGNYLNQFGKGGTGDGEFNEPVGLALDEAGNIYVADAWNRRIQVFGPDYKFLRKFDVGAWEGLDQGVLQSVEHKPYLAINGNTLYISSPRTGQVLAYSLAGQAQELPEVTFNANDWPTGLAIRDNTLYVTNAATGQVMSFVLNAKAQ